MQFSVVTPSFRNSEWLKLCIASVADQGVELEHIVQDGGSTDGTLDWLVTDPRVNVVVEKDNGMYDAINRGFKRARGEILAHLNCDEQYLPGALKAVAEFFQTHPDVDIVFGDAVVVDSNGEYLFHRKLQVPLSWHTRLFPLSTLTCALFFRRKVIDDFKLFFDTQFRISGDSDWMRRALAAKIKMDVLRRFTSVFANTGKNLSLDANARKESEASLSKQPALLRLAAPAVLMHHRLRRVLGGIYQQESFQFALYTQKDPGHRVVRTVSRPTARWKW